MDALSPVPTRAHVENLRSRLFANGYQPVPVVGPDRGGKASLVDGWRKITGVPPWSSKMPNTGINCSGLRVIDIDVDELDALGVRALIFERLGPAPMRTRENSSRAALFYRAAEGKPGKREVVLDKKPPPRLGEKQHVDKVEVLGDGQQVVAYGTHETWVPLEWPDASPLDTPRDELTAVTEEQIDDLLKEIFECFATDAAKASEAIDPAPECPRDSSASVSAETRNDACAALAVLPNDYGYNDWIKIGMSAFAAGVLFEDWDSWSQKHHSYDPKRTREVWQSFQRSGVQKVTAATLFWHVSRRVPGWKRPSCPADSRRSAKGGAAASTLPNKPQAGRAQDLSVHTHTQRDRAAPEPEPNAGGSAAASVSEDPLTQDAVATIFAALFETSYRYCHTAGAWYFWNGTCWRKDETEKALQLIREICRNVSKGESSTHTRRSARKASFAKGAEQFARGDARLAVSSAFWDRDPLLLGTPGGTVDLGTGEIRPGDPADGISKQTAVSPAPTADCPRWLTFLHEAAGGDDEMIRFLQQWCGYNLSGETREHALVFVYGPGKNGKSVFLNIVSYILGDYAVTAAMDTFVVSRGDRHPTDLAMLFGARMVTASETEEGRAWSEARIKQITGGDPITARFMRQDFFTYVPQFKLTIVGNHTPSLHNVDEATRRRFNIVPFTHKPAHPDKQLEEKLKAEAPGILRWMIEGYLDYRANGLMPSCSVVETTNAYFEEQDLLGQWIAEKCDAEPGNSSKWEPVANLFASWKTYAELAGEPHGSKKSFSANMGKRGFGKKRGTGGPRGLKGIRLRQQHHVWSDR